jgi:tartrate dehydratase beta subunit/fumarate hydratase class I family protein
MIALRFPFTGEKIRALKVGDEVLIPDIVFTGRNAALRGPHLEIGFLA